MTRTNLTAARLEALAARAATEWHIDLKEAKVCEDRGRGPTQAQTFRAWYAERYFHSACLVVGEERAQTLSQAQWAKVADAARYQARSAFICRLRVDDAVAKWALAKWQA